MAKITIIGAGDVGSASAYLCAIHSLGDVVLLDIAEGLAKGRALDICQALPHFSSDVRVKGTSSYADTRDSDVVVIVAGFPRKPGMSRDDLLEKNFSVVKEVAEKAARESSEAVMIVVTNPLDAMVYAAYKASGFEPERVVGMAGALDSSRFRYFLSRAAGLSTSGLNALVIGSHGNKMVPLLSTANSSGAPISSFIGKEKGREVIEATRNAAAEIISFLGNRSTMFAPAASIFRMVEAVVKDTKAVIPASAYCNGEYGVKEAFMGVPVVLGRKGVDKVIELELPEEEKAMLKDSVNHTLSLKQKVDSLLGK